MRKSFEAIPHTKAIVVRERNEGQPGQGSKSAGAREAELVNSETPGECSFEIQRPDTAIKVLAKGGVAPVVLGIVAYCALEAYIPSFTVPAIIPVSLGLSLVIVSLRQVVRK